MNGREQMLRVGLGAPSFAAPAAAGPLPRPPAFGGGPMHAPPRFLGPPVQQGSPPRFLGPPLRQGGGGGPQFLGPPVFQGYSPFGPQQQPQMTLAQALAMLAPQGY